MAKTPLRSPPTIRRGPPLWYLPVIVVCGAAVLFGILWLVQSHISQTGGWSEGERPSLLPSSWKELKATAHYIRSISQHHPYALGVLFVAAYMFKQTFSFPGSAALNAFAGVAFGGTGGALLAIVCTGFGTMGAYTLSKYFGPALLHKFDGESKLSWLKTKIERARASGSLLFYLTAIRVAPVFPQWLLNISAPHIGINETMFVCTTTVGLIPYNAITVRAGSMITDLEWEDIFSPTTIATLCGMAALLLLPPIVLKRWENNNVRVEAEKHVK